MKKILFLSLFAVLTISFIGCRTNSQNKIVGTWKFIPPTKPDSSVVNEWYFYAGDLLEIASLTTGADSVLDRYSYTLDGSVLNIYGDTAVHGKYNPSPTEFRGKYWVDKLNDEYLKCVKTEHADGVEGNAYLRVELVKQ